MGLLALAAAGKAVLYDTLDPDCFWHLKVADALHRQGIGPLVDDLSFASMKTPWTPYSWLAELGMKAIWDTGGYRLAVAIQALMQAGIVVILAMIGCEAVNGQPQRARFVSIASLTALGSAMMLPYLSFRPATAAILIFGVVLWLVVRDRRMEGRSGAVWLAVPMTALLTNIHLYAVLVPMVCGLALAAAVWQGQKTQVRRYGLLTLMCGVACLMTPMLAGAMSTAWSYQHSDVMVAGPIIAEMRPFWSGVGGKICGAVYLLLIAAIWRWRKSLDAADWLWMGLGVVLLLRLGRFAPLFAMLSMPALAKGLYWTVSDRVLGRSVVRAALAGVLVIGLARVGWALAGSGGGQANLDRWLNRMGDDAPGYPCEAAVFVEQNITPVSGHLINEFTWGGYLAWRLGGEKGFKVLMDGRTQLYSRRFWEQAYLGSESDRMRLIEPMRADAAILPAGGRSIFAPLLQQIGWEIAYQDARSLVLVPPGEK